MATVPNELAQYAAKAPAQAIPDELAQYVARDTTSGPAQGGASIAPVSRMTNPKLNIAASGENMPEYVGAFGAAGAGLMAAAPMAGPVASFAAKQYLKHPVLGPMIASEVISKLREVPGIGKFIPHAAQYLPWLFSEGGLGKAAGEAAEGSEAAAASEGAASTAARPKQLSPSSSAETIPGNQPASTGQSPPSTAKEQVSLQDLLNKSVGATPLQKNVPLREQLPGLKPPSVAPQPSIPEGFTSANSSVLKAYKYNPAVNEMETITNNGGHYIYGDVSPEQAQALAAAQSKGQAWNAMRNQSPLVAKVLNGKRVPIKPVSASSTEDLTPILQQSLANARQKSVGGGSQEPWEMPSPQEDLVKAVRAAQVNGTNKEYFMRQLTRYMYPSNAAKITPEMAEQAWQLETNVRNARKFK